MTSDPLLDRDVMTRVAKLIEGSSFGTDAVGSLSGRPAATDVAAVCASADRYTTIDELREQPQLLEVLVDRAATGDPVAVSRVLAEVRPMVLDYCRSRLGSPGTVGASPEDVAQEVCLAVLTALPRHPLRGLSFRAFVYGIASHKVTDTFRARNRSRAEPVAEVPDVPLTHDGPEDRFLGAETAAQVSVMLARLPDHYREVLVLRIALGLSAEETAAALDTTPGAVRVAQRRALATLRRSIGEGDAYR